MVIMGVGIGARVRCRLTRVWVRTRSFSLVTSLYNLCDNHPMFPLVIVGLIKLSLRGHGQGEMAQVRIGWVGGSLCSAEEDKGVPAANSHVVISPTIPRTRGTSHFHAEIAAIKPECSLHVVGVHGDMIEYGSLKIGLTSYS